MSAPPGRINRVRVAMLGPLAVRAEDGSPVEVTGARLRTLLILLALVPGRVVTTSRLVDGVWAMNHPPKPRTPCRHSSANTALFMCLSLDEDLGTLSGPTMRG